VPDLEFRYALGGDVGANVGGRAALALPEEVDPHLGVLARAGGQLVVAPGPTQRRLLVDLDQLRDVEARRRLRLLADFLYVV